MSPAGCLFRGHYYYLGFILDVRFFIPFFFFLQLFSEPKKNPKKHLKQGHLVLSEL